MGCGATHLSLALSLMALALAGISIYKNTHVATVMKDFDVKMGSTSNILEQNSDKLSQEFCIFAAVGSVVAEAISRERRMGASLIRLFFHDCFVDGCDGGILLNDIPGRFQGEKTSPPNDNSVRGYEVIDQAKQRIKNMCPGAAVSCADILALAARDSVAMLGGIPYPVRLGRRDARTANFTGSLTQLPAPFDDLNTQLKKFRAKGMSPREMVALAGAHTIGFARCVTMCDDNNINPAMKSTLKCNCPVNNNDTNLVPLDLITPNFFDKAYYDDLNRNQGLLFSDQVLTGNSTTNDFVRSYSNNGFLFLRDFNAAMTKMGDLPPSPGARLEIRDVCSRVNGNSIADM
ncbi:suberization-associated anionic peroxidase 1-like [Nicotiana tomentosiformis]|uniref:suberization-associated anionic peroxidase 1-like n=1 Tax=Nicotiana tomentosiformis TaxID=4098 RepID=UPI00051B77EE|nr:suberization-associated anionic peroxidase 1-like [Nicotiana tomentosiformis]